MATPLPTTSRLKDRSSDDVVVWVLGCADPRWLAGNGVRVGVDVGVVLVFALVFLVVVNGVRVLLVLVLALLVLVLVLALVVLVMTRGPVDSWTRVHIDPWTSGPVDEEEETWKLRALYLTVRVRISVMA